MQHNLDELARLVRDFHIVLSYTSTGEARLAFRYRLPAPIRRALRNRRRGLARMMAAGDVRLCPAPGLHRREWFYAGRGVFTCAVCRRLDIAQLGMWQQAG